MKKKKQSKKSRTNVAARNKQPILKTPAQGATPEPNVPPLAGDALEVKIAEVLCERFRNTADRSSLRSKCQGAEHSAIEAAIVSPRVRLFVEPVAQAYALEQAIAVLQLLFSSAKAALENERASAAQVTALRIIIEILLKNILERIGGGLWQETAGVLFSSEFEKSVVGDILLLLRGEKAPAADELQRAPKTSEERVMANGERSDLSGEFGG